MSPANFEEDKVDANATTELNIIGHVKRETFDKKIDKLLMLIEARPLIQRCLSRWLEEEFDRFRVLTLSRPTSTATTSSDDQSVDLVVWSIGSLSLSQPHALQEFEQLKRTFPTAPVVLLADSEDTTDIAEAIRHGSRGYIPTSLEKREIAEILRFVELGGTFVPASVILDASPSQPNDHARPDAESPFGDLTPRELEVVDLLRQAKSNKVIAYDLDLSESTIKVIVHRILNKLNAANRTEVACLALKYLES
ncbi:MAG: LuxR C-terminal-related transcriptional regulator [Geminicoccaceae bacterium]